MDFINPEEKYRNMGDEELILLAYQPEGTPTEHFPIIQKELIRRGKQDEALALSEYLITINQKQNLALLSREELRLYIDRRIAEGESPEAIQLDLKEYGINIFDIAIEESEEREKAYDYITELKQKDYEEYEIDQKVKEKYAIEQDEVENLRTGRAHSGKFNLILGVVMVIAAVALIPGALEYSGRRYIGTICLLILGVWQVYSGYQKMK